VLEHIHEARALQPMTAFGESRDVVLVLPLELGTHPQSFSTLSFLQLNATSEIVAARAANNGNSSSDDVFDVTCTRALIDSDSPARILK